MLLDALLPNAMQIAQGLLCHHGPLKIILMVSLALVVVRFH
jgi:hypothetical protein